MASRLTVGELFRHGKEQFLSRYGELTPGYQKRALAAISLCQTPALGSTMKECSECRHRELHYGSCYQRGCPTCEGSKDAQWMKERVTDLLPVPYFHVVFTVPHILNDLFLGNQKVCFSLFFDAVRDTLMTVGKNQFNAEVGFFAVMHTWGQLLNFHPHIHCVVPGGGLSFDRTQWVPASKKQRYFASHKVLALVFRGILIKKLKRASAKGTLLYNGDLEQLLTESVKRKWVAHCKPPFDGPIRVIQYLARYVRKVAISNSRLLSFDGDAVAFSWKDYANGSAAKATRLPLVEFIRRFLSHIPVPRFVRIRHYGFLSNTRRRKTIPYIRELIGDLLPEAAALTNLRDSFCSGRCPVCGVGVLVPVSPICSAVVGCDSS